MGLEFQGGRSFSHSKIRWLATKAAIQASQVGPTLRRTEMLHLMQRETCPRRSLEFYAHHLTMCLCGEEAPSNFKIDWSGLKQTHTRKDQTRNLEKTCRTLCFQGPRLMQVTLWCLRQAWHRSTLPASCLYSSSTRWWNRLNWRSRTSAIAGLPPKTFSMGEWKVP